MDRFDQLTAHQAAEVRILAAAVADADGVAPLNEEAVGLLGRRGADHWLIGRDGDLVAYAQWQRANASGQLLVLPEYRRLGLGSRLLDALGAVAPTPSVWSFGDLPGAQAFAAAGGLRAVRALHVMALHLTAPHLTARPLELGEAPSLPDGVRLRSFTPGDTDAFLALNAAAFAGHPEQGHFSADDLAHRQAEPWWDPAGLLLAEDRTGLLGFHWTKRHDATTGEVYVLGVHPGAAGRGLGRTLLDAGLRHLAETGSSRVILYVDADNEAAVRLYERSGFAVVHTDRLYRRVPALRRLP